MKLFSQYDCSCVTEETTEDGHGGLEVQKGEKGRRTSKNYGG